MELNVLLREFDFLRKELSWPPENELWEQKTNVLLIGVIIHDDQNMLREMLAANVDPDFRISDRTPLHFAAVLERPAIMRTLLGANANPDLKAPNGSTPLHEALLCENPILMNEMVQALLDGNASVNIVDDYGHTAEYIIERLGGNETSALLVQHLLRKRFETLNNFSSYATSTLSVKSPLTLSGWPNLCKMILGKVELVYHELDKLPGSGFALGLDILQTDIPLTDERDSKLFSGNFPF
jgi:hypothetical protein